MGILEVLVLVGGYYLWGVDGFAPSTQSACQAAVDNAKICIVQGSDEARQKFEEELKDMVP